MTALASAAPWDRLARYGRWAPETWLLVPVGAAWAVMAAHAAGAMPAAADIAGAGQAILMMCLIPTSRTVGVSLGDWTVMSVGMMIPLVLPVVRHVALNSLLRRRWRATLLFLVAFLAPFLAYGIVVLWFAGALAIDPWAWVAASLLIAAAYQLTMAKRRAVFACRQLVPLPPDGLRADLADLRFGAVSAWRCLRSCWALMLPMAVLGHGALLGMVAVTALALAEDPGRIGPRILVPSAVVLGIAAAGAALIRLA